MIQAKKRLGLFALCATAALSSTSLLVSTAQAAPPNWDVGGAEMGAGTSRALQGTLVGEPNLLSNVLGHMIRITCSTVALNAALNAGGTVTGTASFTNCKTFYGGPTNDVHTTPTQALTELPDCKPLEPIVAGGSGELALHEGKDLIKLTGAPFAVIHLGNEECATGLEFEVKGSFFVEDVGGNTSFLEEKVTHRFQEAVAATLALGGLKFGANAASLDGQMDVSLTSGQAWRGLPL